MRSSFLVAAVLASWMPLALAQTVSGVVTGTVKDQTDAVVVGASLDLINQATGARRAAVTNETGVYTFFSVQPGSYTLQVEQSGFKTLRRTNITLTANERLPIELKLELGATTETVRVEAQGASVQTVSAERSGTVTANQLSTLLLKGRDLLPQSPIPPLVRAAGQAASGPGRGPHPAHGGLPRAQKPRAGVPRSGGDYFDQRDAPSTASRLAGRLEKPGYKVALAPKAA